MPVSWISNKANMPNTKGAEITQNLIFAFSRTIRTMPGPRKPRASIFLAKCHPNFREPPWRHQLPTPRTLPCLRQGAPLLRQQRNLLPCSNHCSRVRAWNGKISEWGQLGVCAVDFAVRLRRNAAGLAIRADTAEGLRSARWANARYSWKLSRRHCANTSGSGSCSASGERDYDGVVVSSHRKHQPHAIRNRHDG